jgi:hypothetical protein
LGERGTIVERKARGLLGEDDIDGRAGEGGGDDESELSGQHLLPAGR